MGLFAKLGLYWHTLRRLKAQQIVGRIVFRVKKVKADLAPPPAKRTITVPLSPVARRRPSLVGKTQFRFLNEEGDLTSDGWDNPDREKLWRYNQHYFDDLNAISAEDRVDWHRDLVARWIAENPPSLGSGWEPYPTSLRIVNWVKWAMLGEPLSADVCHSLTIQTRWLSQKIEWHLLGNHLFANAKALVIAGCFFEGDEAESWLQTGATILLDELPEQILRDGGQFELSPMYHALALEDVLDLINILRASGVEGQAELVKALEKKVDPMLSWLATMSHPDGGIAFFNDAAFGIAPENNELLAYAERLGFSSLAAPSGLALVEPSGYARMATGPLVVIADAAEIGPTYLPGHAHADTLSFECSLYGQRVIVNSGTSLYGLGPERLRQRGTRAHSTVCVDGTNSSHVWSGFRVAQRASISGRRGIETDEALVLEASHDGYHRHKRGLTHERSWTVRENYLLIEDKLTSPQSADAIFHIHPDVQIQIETPRSGAMILKDGHRVNWECSCPARLQPGTWHPEFGVSIPNSHLIAALDKGQVAFKLSW